MNEKVKDILIILALVAFCTVAVLLVLKIIEAGETQTSANINNKVGYVDSHNESLKQL